MSTINDVSRSSSEIGAENQPVTLSIPDRGSIQSIAQTEIEDSIATRIYNVNQKIKRATIYASLNLNNLKIDSFKNL